MSRTGAYNKLSKRRPTTSLVSPLVICSLLVQILVSIAFQAAAIGLLFTQDGFVKMMDAEGFSIEEDNTLFAEVTVIFLVTNFQYVSSVVAFSVAKPFRKPVYTNFWFSVILLATLAFNTYLLLWPSDAILEWFEMVSLPTNVRWLLFALCLVNSLVVYGLEWLQVYLFLQKGLGPCGRQGSKATL